jgi:chromosome segregation protein
MPHRKKIMLNLNSVREAVHQGFDVVVELGNGILRGERRYRDKPFAIAYIDLADDIVARAQNLTGFQERLLGSSFFSSENDLRWNSYLYFLAGPKSMHDAGYLKAKALIESDRHFARKFVLSEQDLSLRLRVGSVTKESKVAVQKDAGATWSEIVQAGQLGVLLEQRPRTKVLELIASGAAFQREARSVPHSVAVQNDHLQRGFLRSLTVDHFRPVNSGRRFELGDINLIFGPNGTGKTSLLEAIEALYCGRVRRDPGAGFSGLKAEVELPTGQRVTVAGTKNALALKARNQQWYGRPDSQSSTISQGFTTFNFLDTDAAFRLSSELDPAEIRQDIDKLLVGAETSKLWNYLSRLEEEVREKLKILNDRLPSLRRQVELLTADVKRLYELPSSANALAKSYRAILAELKAKWPIDSDDAIVNSRDRTRLEFLSRSIGSAISALQVTPVTIHALSERSKSLQNGLAVVRLLASEQTKILDRLNIASRVIRDQQESIRVLEKWHQYCEAGVPALAQSIEDVKSRIAELRAVLSGISVEPLPEVPLPYAALLVGEALIAVREDLEKALQDESSASQALAQRQELGQSLATIRRDLYEAALANIEKTGEESACPICRTLHDPTELLTKIASLIAEEDTSHSDGLRQALQHVRERVRQGRKTIDILTSLQAYSAVLGPSGAIPCAILRTKLLETRAELSQLAEEIARLNAVNDSLEASGMDLASYELTHDAARKLLSVDVSPTDASTVAQALVSHRATHADHLSKANELRQQAAASIIQIVDTFHEVGLTLPTNPSPSLAVTLIERASKQLEDALISATSVGEQIVIADGQSFEFLQRAVDQALAAFDKALHAAKGEVKAQDDLKNKNDELGRFKATLDRDIEAEKNYTKAKDVLFHLVKEHSLDKATNVMLTSIRGQVSEIFARIHSPEEYELGDFEDGRLLVTREKKQPHGIDQVSTGQRAAFALSIFLALNESATSAPPVVLIDDPVAHIDDLNALSFLDYLRDLVMFSQKQIFFATADARLAALFQRKFEFLGVERFRKIVLSR